MHLLACQLTWVAVGGKGRIRAPGVMAKLLLFAVCVLLSRKYGVMLRFSGGMMILSPPKVRGIHVDISPEAISALSAAYHKMP
jgi:hypothetical protein